MPPRAAVQVSASEATLPPPEQAASGSRWIGWYEGLRSAAQAEVEATRAAAVRAYQDGRAGFALRECAGRGGLLLSHAVRGVQ